MYEWVSQFFNSNVCVYVHCWDGADFGLSFAERGELLDYIRKVGSFDENATQFYSAEIILALEYLHGKGIIHR